MENASKALIMAGSILISIMVISLLVLGYNQLKSLEQTRENADATDKMAEYMRRFEQFDRTVYGSELFSLGNLQQDYNASEARVDVGYDRIEITVEIKKEIAGSEYFKTGTYTIEQLSEEQKAITDAIKPYEEANQKYNNRSVKFYSQKSTREIARDFGYTDIPSTLPDSMIMTDYFNDISNQLKGRYNDLVKCIEDIQTYTNLRSIYTEFRTGKQFDCVETVSNEYNGRLQSMRFVEK